MSNITDIFNILINNIYHETKFINFINSEEFNPELFYMKDNTESQSPILNIACRENIKIVRHILCHKEFSSDMLNVTNRKGWTPLMVSCCYNENFARHILTHNKFAANMFEVQNNSGSTAFMIACHFYSNLTQEILNHQMFTSNMLQICTPDKLTAFMIACKTNCESTKYILDHEKFTSDMLNHQSNSGLTAFMIACHYNHKLAEYILNHEKFTSDMLNHQTNLGLTAFMITCQNNYYQLAKYIFDHNKFVPNMLNIKNNNGWTPLIMACKYNSEFAKYILNHDKVIPNISDIVNVATNKGWTPLMIACKYSSNIDLIKELIKRSSPNTLQNKCSVFDTDSMSSNNLIKEQAKQGGQTFLHILAIFNLKTFFQIIKIVDTNLLNVVDNSQLTCFQYLSDNSITNHYLLCCPVCFDGNENMYVFNPCGHKICENCKNQYNDSTCHTCRTNILGKIKIY